MPRTALIDGDIVAFRASAALQQNFSWGDGVVSSAANADDAIRAALQTIRVWTQLAECKRARVAFTGDRNFRKEVLPSYKANRAGSVKPIAYRATVEAVQSRYDTDVVHGLEADDLLGILATTPKHSDDVVVSIDKDLRTIPGWHLNPLKDDQPVFVEESEADLRWLTQTLTGDSVDGYGGCPGVGPVRAGKILKGTSVSDWWPQVVAAFRGAKLTEQDALVMARVARILRRSDYDKSTKEILLWHPQKPERLPLAVVCG